MPEIIDIIAPKSPPSIEVALPFSKSISNRLLILQAVTQGAIEPVNLSDADDTRDLARCLSETSNSLNVGAGGTSLRFLLPYFASKPNCSVKLNGSSRLMERPITPLIDAINALGGKVSQNSEKQIEIEGVKIKGGRLALPSSQSSQFASAILLSSGQFTEGLELIIPDDFPSITYLKMTINLMLRCGFNVDFQNNQIIIKPVAISSKKVVIERDWSAASYWYLLTSLIPGSQIKLLDLKEDSIQGDSICAQIFTLLGVESKFVEDGVIIKNQRVEVSEIGIDVEDFPDLFPSICYAIAGRKMKAYLTGLKTLSVKESNRIKAVSNELSKLNVKCSLIESDLFEIDAKQLRTDKTVIFESHEDHRMAMCSGVLSSILWKAAVRDPHVVSKSYPHFWQHLAMAGFSIQELES